MGLVLLISFNLDTLTAPEWKRSQTRKRDLLRGRNFSARRYLSSGSQALPRKARRVTNTARTSVNIRRAVALDKLPVSFPLFRAYITRASNLATRGSPKDTRSSMGGAWDWSLEK